MAVATAFTPRITHPSQAIARRHLRLAERSLARSSRRVDDAHAGVRRTLMRGRCEERGCSACRHCGSVRLYAVGYEWTCTDRDVSGL